VTEKNKKSVVHTYDNDGLYVPKENEEIVDEEDSVEEIDDVFLLI